MGTTLRIASCNLQTGIGTTRGYWQYLTTAWKYRFPHGSAPIVAAAAFLRSERIDLAALCEVGGGARRTRGVNQLALLTEDAGFEGQAFFGTFEIGDRVRQGNAVCARFPLRAVANHPLPGPGEPRFLSEAEALIYGVRTRVLVAHLSLQDDIRAPQIERIAAIVNSRNAPTILAGDFNVTLESELELLAESLLQQATSAPTFPSWKPRRHLDHLFFSEHFAVRRCFAYDARRFSDHLPLVAEVELGPEFPDQQEERPPGAPEIR